MRVDSASTMAQIHWSPALRLHSMNSSSGADRTKLHAAKGVLRPDICSRPIMDTTSLRRPTMRGLSCCGWHTSVDSVHCKHRWTQPSRCMPQHCNSAYSKFGFSLIRPSRSSPVPTPLKYWSRAQLKLAVWDLRTAFSKWFNGLEAAKRYLQLSWHW